MCVYREPFLYYFTIDWGKFNWILVLHFFPEYFLEFVLWVLMINIFIIVRFPLWIPLCNKNVLLCLIWSICLTLTLIGYLCLFFFFFLVCLHCLIKSLTSHYFQPEPLYFSILWACQLLELHCPFPFLFWFLKQIYFNFFFGLVEFYTLTMFSESYFCIASNLTFIFLSFPTFSNFSDPRKASTAGIRVYIHFLGLL